MERFDTQWAEGYEIVSRLGRGSYGEVYRAVQRSTGQTVAVKVLQIRTGPHAPPKATQIERFRREMAACSTLQHPNIVRAIDAGTTKDGQLFSVFEYVPGPTLRAVLQEHRALPLRRLRDFMLQTLDALVCAHASGVIHRDFKPENIVVSTTGARPNFKVLDFGISALVRDMNAAEARLTATDEAVGTPAYAAPEQLRGETPTAKTDLYAWGLVSLECLTGRPAVEGLSVAEVHYQQLSPHEIRLPAALEGHPLGELLRWVLVKQPERRASEASAVYAKLEATSFEDLGAGDAFFARERPGAAAAVQPTDDIALGPRGERRLLTAVSLRFTVSPTSPSGQSQPQDGATAPTTASELTGSGVTASEVRSSGTLAAEGALEGLLDGVLQDQRLRCQQALQGAGGQLVAFTGNRALGVFGFPQLHEHDARRAARFALDVHQGVMLQSHSLRARSNMELRVSGGVHTGLVTLRGDEASADQVAGLVLAEAIDLGDIARAGDILLSSASELGVRRDLEFQPAGDVELPASGKRWAVFRLVGERDPFAASSSSVERAALLGRDDELHRLEREFAEVARGAGRSVWVEGEPGVGKSYLIDHFRTAATPAPRRWLQLRCLPESQQVALHPVLQLVRQQLGLSGLDPEAAMQALRDHLERRGMDPESSMPLFCPWLQLPLNDPRPPRYAPQRMRELAIEGLAHLVLDLLGDEPAVLALEDAHWADATTREWVTALRKQQKDRPVLFLATSRPSADAAIKTAAAPDAEIQLRGLSDADAATLITRLAGDQTIEPTLAAEMVRRADGVPLFLEELTRYVISHRIVKGGSIAIPHSLRELLGARLDQLGPAKITAQVAAVIGREFDLRLLERVALRESGALLGDVEQLVSAGLVQRQRRVGAPRYRFHHALIQATAYDSLVPASREQIHLRVAQTLEAEFPEVVRTEPQVLAQHWAGAKDVEKALGYAKRASMDLLMRSSHLELIEQSQLALSWLGDVPDEGKRVEHELDLTLPYLLASMSTRGWAEEGVSRVVDRTESLLASSPSHAAGFALLNALAVFYHVRGVQRRKALEVAERLATEARANPVHRQSWPFVNAALANIHFVNGSFHVAQRLVDEVCAEYEVARHAPLAWQFGFDARVSAAGAGAVMSWISGDPAKALEQIREVKQLAGKIGHPESLGQSVFFGCVLAHCAGDKSALVAEASQLARLGREHRLSVFSAYAELFRAWLDRNVHVALSAVNRLAITGQVMGLSYQLLLLAQIEQASGDVGSASLHIDKAIAHAETVGEGFWRPRLYIQRALLRRDDDPQAALASLDFAASEAERAGMLIFELEASLAYATTSGTETLFALDEDFTSRTLGSFDHATVAAVLQSARRMRAERSIVRPGT